MIANIQIKKFVGKFLEKNLKSGLFPQAATVISAIGDFFKDRMAGFPQMKLRTIGFRELSNPAIVNDTFDEIRNDLEVLYEESIDQTRRLLVNFNWAQGERNKIEQEVSDINGTLSKLLFLSANGEGYYSAISDNFSDLSKVNQDAFAVIENRNLIPAEVDLKGNFVRLKERLGKIHKYDISKSSIHTNVVTSTTIIQDSEVGLQSCLDDDENTAWLRRITTKGSNVNVSMSIDILTQDSKKSVVSSGLTLTQHTPKATSVQITLEDSSGKREILEKRSFTTTSVWYFNPMDVSKIILQFSKSDSDEEGKNPTDTHEEIQKIFRFGVSNIGLFISEFEETGEFVSTGHDIEKLTKDPNSAVLVRLDVNQAKPPNTDIKFWISSDGNLWKRIYDFADVRKEASKIVRVGFAHSLSLNIEKKKINSEFYPDESALGPTLLYFIGNLRTDDSFNSDIIPSSLQVFKGYNQFEVTSFEYSWRLNDPVHISGLSEFNNFPAGIVPETVNTYYKNKEGNPTDGQILNNQTADDSMFTVNGINELLSFTIPKDKRSLNYKFTTFVYVEQLEGLVLKPESADLNDASDIFSASLFINSKEVWQFINSPLKNEETLFPDFIKLKNGWNRIDFTAYVDTVLTANQKIIFQFNQELSPTLLQNLKMFADNSELLQLPIFELANNRRSQDKTVYGIDNASLYVNFNPNSPSETETSLYWENTRFLAKYSYIKAEEKITKLYFRSQLSRDPDTNTLFLTPTLKDYRLSFTWDAITNVSELVDIEPEQEQEGDEFVIFHTTQTDWEGL